MNIKGSIEELKTMLHTKGNVVIVTHQNPDGDALGAASALALLLHDKGCKVRIITPNNTPIYLRSIEAFDFITDFLCFTPFAITTLREADFIYCLDFNNIATRTGEVGVHIKKNKKALKVIIDHHQDPDMDACDLVFSDGAESSTCHLLMRLLVEMDMVDSITDDIASSLYTGMMTDTGNFSFGNLSSTLYKNIALLVDSGAKPAAIANRIFNVKSEESLRLKGHAICENMVLDYSTCSAYISLTLEELARFTYTSGDTEGLVNIPLSIKGIYNSALFTESDGYIKISLRSIKDMGADMNSFARTHFVGGGHINAAGARSFTDRKSVV